MTSTIDLGDVRQNGVRRVASAELATLAATAHAAGCCVRRVDIAGCTGKPELLHRIAAALAFPADFGQNWDALADCLRDLAWLPAGAGYVWLFAHTGDFCRVHATNFGVLRQILDGACADWRRRGVPCFAFLDARPPTGPARADAGT
ncbi:MAG TPA: barstar family protein [Rhodanobacteraceae bacterium]